MESPSHSPPHSMGVIAGNGDYPRTFVEAARKAGVRELAVAAFRGETEPDLETAVDAWIWLRVGQLSKMIAFFQRQSIHEAVMVGQIAPRNLFDLRPDMRTLLMLGRLEERNAESIFRAVADELARGGIHLLPATTFLEDHMPPAGLVAGPPLSKRQLRDAQYGFRIAKEVSRLDIGQTVLVKHGTVLAVEGFEGTNEAIRRGGSLGRGKALMAKVSKPNQDLRFDVPVIGPMTVETAVEAGVKAIVIEAGRTLLLEADAVEDLCRKHGISILAKES